MNNPLVSVLIPCYNVEKYVEDAVNSILTQTYKNLEVIAINDCSTDRTREILYNLANKDSRIKVFDNETNLKLIKTLNNGIDLCSGEFIARMDADDISFPERIEKQVQFFLNNEDYDIISTMFYTFRAGTKKKNLYINPTKYEDLQAFLLFKSGICHPAAMIRKSFFTRFNIKFESKYLHVEDYGLWSEALYKTKIANLSEPLLYYRVHENQVSSLNEQIQIENKREVFKIHCRNWNIDETQELLDIYSSVAESDPKYTSLDFILKCEQFMLMLLEKNKEELHCSQAYLTQILALSWIRLCANSRLGIGVLKHCFKSQLFNKEYYSSRDYCILIIKCSFRLKYKKSFLYKLIFR